MSDPYNLTVKVTQGKVFIEADGGAEKEAPFGLDELHEKIVIIFDSWLRKGKIETDEELEVLGNVLYRAIFPGEVGAFFETKVTELNNQRGRNQPASGDRLRVELVFAPDAAKWGNLPWEFLYYPPERTPLATKANLSFWRYTPTGRNRETLKPSDSLRVLFVVVQPEEFLKGISTEVASTYREYFDSIVQQVTGLKNAQIEIVPPLMDPTPETLMASLGDYRPHVVHYIGYGRYMEGGQIAFINPQSKAVDWHSKSMFAGYFDAEQLPSLVFLQLCEGPGNLITNDYLNANFAELAPELILKRIPAVVAMRYPVHPEVARKFTEEFYKHLTQGKSVGTAVQMARRSSHVNTYKEGFKHRNMGSPVLFMHSNDGLIVPLRASQTDIGTHTSAASTGTSARAGSSAGQAVSESGAPEFSFDDLVDVGFESGRALSLRDAEMTKEIEVLRSELSGQDVETALRIIARKVQDVAGNDPSSKWVTVYSAMVRKLKSSSR